MKKLITCLCFVVCSLSLSAQGPPGGGGPGQGSGGNPGGGGPPPAPGCDSPVPPPGCPNVPVDNGIFMIILMGMIGGIYLIKKNEKDIKKI